MKDFIIHIEWEGTGKKEKRYIQATDIQEARQIARKSIYNPSINYGYSYHVTENKIKAKAAIQNNTIKP